MLRLPGLRPKPPAPSHGMLPVMDSQNPRMYDYLEVYDWASTHLFLAQVRRAASLLAHPPPPRNPLAVPRCCRRAGCAAVLMRRAPVSIGRAFTHMGRA